MNWIKRLLSRRRIYSDLTEAIHEHLAEKIDELVASGMSREEARHAARREFGNATLIEERGREVWQWPSMESLIADIRYALRMLRKNPGFTSVAILTLALGIGANTAIFSVINAVILRPPPFPNSEQLVTLFEQDRKKGYEHNAPAAANFLDWRAQNNVFSQMAAYGGGERGSSIHGI
jgi:hypothetical protein